MENIIFRKSLNEQGRITEIEIGGALVLENSKQLKDEILSVTNILGGQVKITISNPEDIDLSCIQLFIAFIKFLNETHVKHQLNWTLDEDQRALLENVGLSNDLYLNNSYV